jgi:hypothetical protein
MMREQEGEGEDGGAAVHRRWLGEGVVEMRANRRRNRAMAGGGDVCGRANFFLIVHFFSVFSEN